MSPVQNVTDVPVHSSLRGLGYAPASIKRKIFALKVFCSFWMRKQELAESPFWRVKLQFGRIERLPRTLTTPEITNLLMGIGSAALSGPAGSSEPSATEFEHTAADATYRRLRDIAMIDLMFATGIRVGELAALDIGDYAVTDATFTIRGKGGRERLAFTVDIQTAVIQQAHLTRRIRISTSDAALFVNHRGTRLSTQSIAKALLGLCKQCGIERRITPHMLRHTVATLLLRNGADIRVVQDFLGHMSIVTTQRYTQISKEHLLSALSQYHPSISLRMMIH
jgi:integrase/recombinase XerD